MKTKEKIILIYPFIQTKASDLIAPLSLVYIATPLKDYFKISIIDARVDKQWRDTLKRELESDRVICVGISSMTGPQIRGGIEAASIVRDHSPFLPIVWGGVHPSLMPEETVNNEFVDIVVIGDGEETFKKLVEEIQKGGSLKNVDGIIYKENGSIIRTPSRKQFPLNTLSNPAYDLLNLSQYISTPAWTSQASLPVITSRGCPMRCAYCYNTEFSHKHWTSLSAENTVSSIAYLVNKYRLSGVFLLDDNFFVNLSRVKEICQRLLREKLDIEIYNANCRADSIAKMETEFLKLLKKAGFNQIFIGVESGSQDVLNRIKKDITIEQVLDGNKKLKSVGIRPFYSFMIAFPFETKEDINKTLILMRRLLRENPDAIVYKLQFFTPFPGTELFDTASDLGMEFPRSFEEWSNYHYDKLNYDGFDGSHKKFLEKCHYYSTFLDKKLSMGHKPYIKLITSMYSEILQFRVDRNCYSFMWELHPLKIAQKIRKRLIKQC